MEKRVSIAQIFIAFLYSGIILLGGGYVILPILQSELIRKRSWITEDELMDYYALSQSLPGLISINLSIFIGYKLRGKWGALAGVVGITFGAFWAIVLLASIISNFLDNIYVQHAFWGIEIAVVVLIIASVREMWTKAVFDKETFLIFLAALCIMLFTKISPAYVIIAATIFGIVYKSIKQKYSEREGNK